MCIYNKSVHKYSVESSNKQAINSAIVQITSSSPVVQDICLGTSYTYKYIYYSVKYADCLISTTFFCRTEPPLLLLT